MSGTTHRGRLPVALFVPNILGYARILLAFVGLAFSVSQKPVEAVTTWILAAVLDMFDGALARMLAQTSQFGVLLDIAADNVLRSCVWGAVTSAAASGSTSAFQAVSLEAAEGAERHPQLCLPLVSVGALFFICLEWVTMVCTQVHSVSDGEHWKHARARDPWFVRIYFANNFRNPFGMCVSSLRMTLSVP